jgi:hypothetical protein
MVFYQSEWAYNPQSKEAQEFILAAAAVRTDVGKTVK